MTSDFWLSLLYLSPGEFIYRLLFWYYGWLVLAIMFLGGARVLWLKYIRTKWSYQHKYVVLAIDVPRLNQQSPKAVENIFTYLAGAHKNPNLMEKWWDGYYQLSFSFEIVSLEGYIQFLVHTPTSFRNLVESAVYSQYPDAEITEVEDYTKGAISHFPDDEYDIWGSEVVLTADEALPIRVYTEFESKFGKPEMTFKDPMASLMDLMGSLGTGEQLWYQIILIPMDHTWTAHSKAAIATLLGEASHGHGGFLATVLKPIVILFEIIMKPLWHPEHVDAKPAVDGFKMFNLKPSEKNKLDAITLKASKLAFEVKMRLVYYAKKEVMNKPKVVSGFFGYVKQFASNELNGFKPDSKYTSTNTAYFFKERRAEQRKTRIMHNYQHRSDHYGHPAYILNVEELATIWHFPVDSVVKAPLMQKVAGRRVEPPMVLPTGERQVETKNIEPIFGLPANEGEQTPEPNFAQQLESAPNNETAPETFPDTVTDNQPDDQSMAAAIASQELNTDSKGSAPDNLPFG